MKSKNLQKKLSYCYKQAELCSSIANYLSSEHEENGNVKQLDVDVLSSFLSKRLLYMKKLIADVTQIVFEESQ